MRRFQKILALSLVGTGAFMLPAPLPAQAAAVQSCELQSTAAVQCLQKVTAVTHVYGSGEQVDEAILEYPKELLPSSVKSTDFAVTGKEIASVTVNDKPEPTGESKAGRYVILHFITKNNVYDGDLSQKPDVRKSHIRIRSAKERMPQDAPAGSFRIYPFMCSSCAPLPQLTEQRLPR